MNVCLALSSEKRFLSPRRDRLRNLLMTDETLTIDLPRFSRGAKVQKSSFWKSLTNVHLIQDISKLPHFQNISHECVIVLFFYSLVKINNETESDESSAADSGQPENRISRERSISAPNVCNLVITEVGCYGEIEGICDWDDGVWLR